MFLKKIYLRCPKIMRMSLKLVRRGKSFKREMIKEGVREYKINKWR